MSDDRYLTLRELASYAGVSLNTLRRRLVDPVRPLPHYRVGARIVVKRSEYDRWMEAGRVDLASFVDRAAAEVLHGLKSDGR